MADLQLTPVLKSHIARYAESHSNPVNQALHTIGIPLLVTSSLGLLGHASESLSVPHSTWLMAIGTELTYARWDRRAALGLAAIACGCYTAGRRWPARTLFAMFGVGVILHAVGHYGFEGKPPAFLSRPVAILESPPWLLRLALGAIPHEDTQDR